MSAHRADDRGAVIAIAALSMVMLIAFVAIAVDLGMARQERRHAQNGVDAAALAAAAVYDGTPDGATAASDAALDYLNANDYDLPGEPTGSLTYACLAGGCAVDFAFSPLPVLPAAPATRRCVSVRLRGFEVPTGFARVIGVDSVNVGASANGCKRVGSPAQSPAVFTGGQTCSGDGKAFVTSGNLNHFEGGIHSNFDVKDSGSGNVVASGTKTRVGPVVEDKGLWAGATVTTAQAWPIDPDTVTASLYAPGAARATLAGGFYSGTTGDRTFSGNVPAGVYYTTGKITLSGVTITSRTVDGTTRAGATFVTSGSIVELSGNDQTLTAFEDDPNRIVFFSGWSEKTGGDRCDSETVKFGGNCNHFDGVVFAPFGKVRLSGEGNGNSYSTGSGQCGPVAPQHPTFSGGVISWAFESSGNYHLLRGGPVELPPDDSVMLDQ